MPESLETLRARAVEALRNVSTRRGEEEHARSEPEWAERSLSDERYLHEAGSRRKGAKAESRRKRAEYRRKVAEDAKSRSVIAATIDSLTSVDPTAWQQVCREPLAEGVYGMTLRSLSQSGGDISGFEESYVAVAIAIHAGVTIPVAQELMKRVEHVGPESLLTGVSLDDVVAAKRDFERIDAKVKVTEGARPGSFARTSIPEKVRGEVWRRDSARCADCGSRERLEFDHIVPVAKGGSNTARNIELRCETCNRRKSDRI